MYTNSKLAKAVRLALMFGAAATAMTANTAIAQEDSEAEDVEKISVTGSRIKRTDMETASPVTMFSADDIAASGLTTLEDFIQNVPAMNGGSLGSTVNNGNAGLATAALRGLGSGRTLLLINGRRFNSNDLNGIPTSIIERVDIVRDGASTIYGSDAIAGVVNFVTKRNFEGIEISTQYDITGEGDGETTKFAVVTGASNDKGNVVFSLDYTNRNAIGQGDRKFSECPLFENDSGTYCGGSSHSHFGRVNVPKGTVFNGEVLDNVNYVLENGQAVPFSTAAHGYNYAALSYLVTPQEVFSMYASGTYELSDDLTFFSEAGFTARQSDQLMAPVATFWSADMPATNPYNPFGVDVTVNRRLTETGGRNFTQDANDYRFVSGLEGGFDNGWTWDLSYNYSRFVDARVIAGQINRPRMETLLDPAKCGADAACPEVWNPLAQGTLTQEMINYASVTHSPVRRGTTTQFMGNIAGDFGDFELPGGTIGWAAGFERRTEKYLFQPDGAAALGQIYFVSGEKTEGSYSVNEMYAEISAPILDNLNVTAAIRSSDYSNLDDTATNSKIGVEYTPMDDLLLRATFAEGFRAPSITELFAPQRQSAQSYNDPCTNWGSSSDANVRANCAADGLPENFVADGQAAAVLGGNPELGAEESESFTAGLVFSGIENFSMALDYFDIEITNGIGTAGTSNVTDGCYQSANFSSPYCDLIRGHSYGPIDTPPHPTSPRRNVNGVISGVLLTNANLSTFETAGVDFDFAYSMDDVLGGKVKTSFYGTWLTKYDYLPLEGAQVVDAVGTFTDDQWTGSKAVFAEWKTNLQVKYEADDYVINTNVRYQSEGKQYLAPDKEDTRDSIYDDTADAVVYVDLQGTYYINDNYNVSAGVRNLFDKQAPYSSSNQDMNTINASFDLAGQYWYAKFTAKF